MADPDSLEYYPLPEGYGAEPTARIAIRPGMGDLAATDAYSPDAFDVAASKVQRRYAAPQRAVLPAGPNDVMDTLRSIPRGVMGGLADTAAVGGQAAAIEMGDDRPQPTGEEGLNLLEQNVTGALPQPQTTGGQVGASIGHVAGNPANWVAPGLMRTLGYNVASGITSELGRKLYEGTPNERVAQLLGGFGPGVAERASALYKFLPQNAAGVLGGKMIQPTRMGDIAALPAAPPIMAGDTRVSTRFPTAVAREQDPLAQHLSIGLPEMQASPGYAKNIHALDAYPGFAHLQGMGTDEAARAYIRQAAGNLGYLYERSPEIMRQRSPLWYEGANRISDALAQRWGVPRPAASGALASLSPQMDWFKNASLGERTGDILTNAAAGRPMTSAMGEMARSEKMLPTFSGERTGPVNRELLRRITGKTLDQLTDPREQALWVRLYDEAHNPRAYRTITPEGNFGNFEVSPLTGKLKDVGWGGLDPLAKAITALRSGGDMNIISPALGGAHKVRSFYNNIENPFYPRFGDVTADTHQVAAAQMRPLSGSSPAVEQNLSGDRGGSGSDVTGVRGTYGLTADATRMMAREYGLLPRAAQSATWEPVRTMFTSGWKTPANAARVDNIWRQYDRGEISIEQARDAIFSAAGGIRTPSWAERDLATVSPGQGSTYR